MYKDNVLPRVLEQVFPDEYHLQTLEPLLDARPQLQLTVDIKTVLSRLMDRLSNYAASNPDVLPEFLQVEASGKLSNATGKVIEAQVDMPIVGVKTLYISLLTFTFHVHPDRLDYIDQVPMYLDFTAETDYHKFHHRTNPRLRYPLLLLFFFILQINNLLFIPNDGTNTVGTRAYKQYRIHDYSIDMKRYALSVVDMKTRTCVAGWAVPARRPQHLSTAWPMCLVGLGPNKELGQAVPGLANPWAM
ncbi:hypothetical protein Q3G72_024577 [Acer saccharum]|nr:hypothetical protein Q3G72_024577 [Acer saccharum]